MIRHAKRNTGILSSLFALIDGAILLLVNGILVIDNLLGKITGESQNLAEKLFTFSTDPYSVEYIDAQKKFTLFYCILFFVGLVLIVSAFKYFKKPIDKKGNITYKKGLLCFETIVSLAVAGVVLLGIFKLKDFNFVDIDKMNIFCYAELGLAVLSIAFAVISLLIKTRVYNLKTMVKPFQEKKIEVSTLYANDKLQKIKQLKELGVLSEKEYNDATAKYTQSV